MPSDPLRRALWTAAARVPADDPLLAALLAQYTGRDDDPGDGADADGSSLPGLAGLDEDALALAFTRRHRETLRYCHAWGQWLQWDGARWAPERTLAVFDLARRLVREVAAVEAPPPKLAVKLRSAATVGAIVTLARADRAHARTPEAFDQDPWLLNTPAGTVELRTGALRPHRRADGLTKVTAVAPGQTAEAPRWQACLRTWTQGDEALIGFLQRWAGYCLTGSVREEKLAFLYGSGGNGKTRFVETLRGCLGPGYVTSLAMETLIVTAGEQHPTDLADLRGARLAIATETEEGRRFAEAKVKALTGGDRLRARYMRKDFFEFAPTHKLLIMGNHRPLLRNVDEAMRRRLLLVPFEAVIPPEARDPDLAGKLRAESPAILRWMLDGCLAWQAEGLRPPARVLAATEEYLETADAIGRWVDECCVPGPSQTMGKAMAFASWKAWAEAAGEFVGSERRLSERLARLPGLDEVRLGKGRTRAWLGLGLRREGAE
jgi:putative DNA primase/helicase